MSQDKNKQDSKQEAPSKADDVGFWDIDPLKEMADLVLGNVFEAPKAVAKEVTKQGGKADHGTEDERREATSHSITFNLGDVFRKSKRKLDGSAAATGTKEEGKTAGKSDKDGAGDGE